MQDFDRSASKLAAASAAGEPSVVDVPEARFLQLDGHGGPASDAFARAVDTLTDVAHALRGGGPIEPLEAPWWWEEHPASEEERAWHWTLMVRQPPGLSPSRPREAADGLRRLHGSLVDDVRLATFLEGRCVQLVHVGAYAALMPSLERLHARSAAWGSSPAAGTTRSTSTTRARRRPRACARSCGGPSSGRTSGRRRRAHDGGRAGAAELACHSWKNCAR